MARPWGGRTFFITPELNNSLLGLWRLESHAGTYRGRCVPAEGAYRGLMSTRDDICVSGADICGGLCPPTTVLPHYSPTHELHTHGREVAEVLGLTRTEWPADWMTKPRTSPSAQPAYRAGPGPRLKRGDRAPQLRDRLLLGPCGGLVLP